MREKLGPDHYRFEDSIGPHGVTLECRRYIVIGETPQCYYVIHDNMANYAKMDNDWGRSQVKRYRKRVLKSSWRRFCYPELDRAMESYRQRKSWQIRHAKIALSRAEAGMAEAERLLKGTIHAESFEGGVHRCEGGEYIKGLNWGDY